MSESRTPPPPRSFTIRDSLLHLAALNGDVRTVRQQLAKGAGVNSFALSQPEVDDGISCAHSCSPLMLAVSNGHPEVVRMLLAGGADVSALFSDDGDTILIESVRAGNCEIVKMLLKAKSDSVSTPNSRGCLPLYIAAGRGNDRIVEVVLSSGANIDSGNVSGVTAIMAAAINGHKKCVERLLHAGADPLKVDERGFDACHYAAQQGFVDIVEILVRCGAAAAINNVNRVGGTLLMSAAIKRHLHVVRFLLPSGADPFVMGAEGATVFHVAEDLVIFKALLEDHQLQAAAYVDTVGDTLFHYAVKKARPGGFLCALFKTGLDPSAKNERGVTAADIAREAGQIETAKLLALFEAKYRERRSNETKDSARLVCEEAVTAGDDLKASIVHGSSFNNVEVCSTSSSRYEVVKEPVEVSQDAEMKQPDWITALLTPVMSRDTVEKVEESNKNSSSKDKEKKFNKTKEIKKPAEESNTTISKDEVVKDAVYASQDEEVKEYVDTSKGTQVEQSAENAEESNTRSNSNERVNVNVSINVSQDAEVREQPVRKVQPCLHCHTLTHRRCARCRTAYICSHDCQVATIVEHRQTCMEIYEERQARKVAGI